VARRSRRGEAPLAHGVAALERTALAWERTAVSLGAVGLLLVKVVEGGWPLRLAGGVRLVGCAAIVLVVVPWGYQRARARIDPAQPGAPFTGHDPTRVLAVALTAAAVSLTVVAVAVELWWVAGG